MDTRLKHRVRDSEQLKKSRNLANTLLYTHTPTEGYLCVVRKQSWVSPRPPEDVVGHQWEGCRTLRGQEKRRQGTQVIRAQKRWEEKTVKHLIKENRGRK
jgi:hypothetical protein